MNPEARVRAVHSDQRHRCVLVTGGTRGLGLATARALARQGARCVLTYSFGSADESQVRRLFNEDGSLEPYIVRADVTQADETHALITELRVKFPSIDVLVSNAATALVVRTIEDYTERGLLQSVRGSVWPTFEYLFRLRDVFGAYPRYVVVISSTGPDSFCVQYDFVAAAKAMLETLCRYMSHRLRDENVSINIVRTRGVLTDSLDATFGAEMKAFVSRFVRPGDFIRAEEVADVVVALCSGLLDGMRGQTITVDRGTTFHDNITHFFAERAALGIG